MFRKAVTVGIALAAVAAAGTARAERFEVCFEPGKAGPTTEGYIAVANAARAGQARFGLHYVLAALGDRDGDPDGRLWRARLAATQLELVRLGASPGLIDMAVDSTTAPAASPCVAVDVRERVGIRVVDDPILYFSSGHTDFHAEQMGALELLLAPYRPDGEWRVDMRVFSDTAGSAESNMILGRRRADSVTRTLIRLGVRARDIQWSVAGEDELARPTADGVAEPLNRRVQIHLYRRGGAH